MEPVDEKEVDAALAQGLLQHRRRVRREVLEEVVAAAAGSLTVGVKDQSISPGPTGGLRAQMARGLRHRRYL